MSSSTDAGAFARLDRDRFFASIRSPFGSFTQDQVDWLNRLIDVLLLHAMPLDRRPLASILVTSLSETGKRMMPVRKGFASSDAAVRRAVASPYAKGKISRNDALPNSRGLSFYGRGDFQRTCEANDTALGKLLGLDLEPYPTTLGRDASLGMRLSIRKRCSAYLMRCPRAGVERGTVV